MKIKLSKSQWEMVGKKAGWMKTALFDTQEGTQTSDPGSAYSKPTEYSNKSLGSGTYCGKFLELLDSNPTVQTILQSLNDSSIIRDLTNGCPRADFELSIWVSSNKNSLRQEEFKMFSDVVSKKLGSKFPKTMQALQK